jgi:tripartite-type tricarboxylate transporter receptor subunit TctC
LAALALPARAQLGFEPIRIIFPFAAGGSGDTLARLLAEHLRLALAVPVIVENRTGAQGRIGVQAVKAAAPDGKTLLLTPVAPMSVYEHVYKSLGYDPITDFEPLSQVATFDFALAVGPQVPAKSLKELVDWIKANPTQGSYGISRGRLTAALLRCHVREERRPRFTTRRLPRLRHQRSSTSSLGSCQSLSPLRPTY